MALDDYDQMILGAAAQYKVDPRLLKAIMSVESSGNPAAVGAPFRLPNGRMVQARGLMQFAPDTAAQYKVDVNNPQSSINGGANYLSDLLNQYGSPELALNHYSGGDPGYTKKILQAYNSVNLPGTAPSIPTPAAASPGAGQAGAGAGGIMTPHIVDMTQQAGFGDRFGTFAQPPIGMIIHHTGGGSTVDQVINTYKARGFPAQFVIGRDGTTYQTLPDGAQGRQIQNGWGPLGEGKSNANTEGVEVIANNDQDVTPAQQQAAAGLVEARSQKWGYDPQTSVWGHGEVNPGHKEPDEGRTITAGIRNGSLLRQIGVPENQINPPPQITEPTPQTAAAYAPGAVAPAGPLAPQVASTAPIGAVHDPTVATPAGVPSAPPPPTPQPQPGATPVADPTEAPDLSGLPPEEQTILSGKPLPATAAAPAPTPAPPVDTAGLPSEEQAAIAGANAPPPPPGPTPTAPLWSGDWAGPKLVQGVEQGVRDVGSTLNSVDAYLAKNIPGYAQLDAAVGYTPQKAAQVEAQTAADTAAYNQANPSNLSWAGAGRLGGNILATAPVGGAGRLIGAGAELVPGLSLAARPLEWGTAGGLANALTSGGSTPQDWGTNALLGAAGGAALGGATGLAGRALFGSGANAIAERLGIDLSKGQTGGALARRIEDTTAAFPFSGAPAFDQGQRQQIAGVIGRELGMPGEVSQIDTPTLNQARSDIADRIEDAAGNITVRGTPLLSSLSPIETASIQAGPNTPQAHTFRNLSDQLLNLTANNNGDLPGSEFQKFISRGGPLDTALSSSVPEVRSVGQGIRTALLNAAQGGTATTSDALANLAKARYQWKVAKTIEPAITKTQGGTEEMSLPGLAQNIRTGFDMTGTGPGNNMQDLARLISGPLRTLPSSGTAERLLWQKLLMPGEAAGSAAAAFAGMPHVAAAVGALAPLPSLAGRYMRFGPAMGIPGLGAVQGVTNPLIARTLGGNIGNRLVPGGWLPQQQQPQPGQP